MERRLIKDYVYNRLPVELRKLTHDFEGRERDIVLLSSLAVLSNCIPKVYGVYDGDNIYPHLYVVIIAPAASGKGVMNHSRLLIDKIHDKIFKDSLDRIKDYENQKKKDRKESDGVCPQISVKIMPANISTSEMYTYMGHSKHGLIIIESEADTMSNMLKNDWSNYSDVLRKAFHHEPISISRKIDKVFEDIKEPKLAMLISGTPDQLQPLIKSKENGLFSRFIIYNFDEISPFKDVFAKKTRRAKLVFENIGDEIFSLYDRLSGLESPIEFLFTENQERKFLKELNPIRNDVIENHSQGFVSNVHRHGLVFYRLAMILTVLRNINEIHTMQKVVCDNVDFLLAFDLMKTLLRHSQFTYNTIDNGILSIQDEELLDGLSLKFTRKDIIAIGETLGIPVRTIDDKLAQWKRKKIIKKVDRNNYQKL